MYDLIAQLPLYVSMFTTTLLVAHHSMIFPYLVHILILVQCYVLTFVFGCIFIFLSRESDQSAMTSSLRSCLPPVFHTKMGESHEVPFPVVQKVNLPTCSPHCPINAKHQAGKLFKYQF